ncbi:Glycosyl hydrolases family 43 [Granulicella rosea]|uniref:Glycosyl hydrolases family 43 n=1 Tax=Granulicella rosea TaxID=474952 RepID=A0A239M5L6_9BACT|nr:family 43 glycosylhydrolase [Granulicella rosea]SNT38187.1 Glycosyl hydrolases family 43 [Granulicella rosea]
MNRPPFLRALLLAMLLLSTGLMQAQQPAAKPLFRDPVHDGAADPTLIYNRAKHEWWMFYTNRRADLATGDPKDVAWVHGTRIGIAVSKDRGASWTYRGEAAIPYGTPDYTHWAPDIVFWQGKYHMFLVIVPGTFKDWNAPREIIHLTSPDLEHWSYLGKIDSGSDRIIDPSLFQLPGGPWRVWYKDERDHSHLYSSDSTDLVHWSKGVPVITDRSSEAPKVFRWKDQYWMITDPWRGLGVYSSKDLEHWTHQPENILQAPGTLPTDRTEGHHCDVVVHDGHAYIFYFTHQKGADLDPKLPHSEDRTVIQAGELELVDGKVVVDRDKPVHVDLGTQ